MNCFGRTPNNKVKLRLKSFHRRTIRVNVIKSLLDCKPEKEEVIEGNGGYKFNFGDQMREFSYTLEEIINDTFRQPKRINTTFNKSQPIGKVMLIGNKRYRVINKG